MALIVSEPSLSGIHDLERVLGLCRHFGVGPLVCINKHDLSEENAQSIEEYCAEAGIEVVARIPFDTAVTDAIIQGAPVVELSDGAASRQIKGLWKALTAC
jgi:MinD superfamily P-loop ATPase